jgi:hypothetical protein
VAAIERRKTQVERQTVTMRYAHPNLGSKRDAVAKLEGVGHYFDSVRQNEAGGPKLSPNAPLRVVGRET